MYNDDYIEALLTVFPQAMLEDVISYCRRTPDATTRVQHVASSRAFPFRLLAPLDVGMTIPATALTQLIDGLSVVMLYNMHHDWTEDELVELLSQGAGINEDLAEDFVDSMYTPVGEGTAFAVNTLHWLADLIPQLPGELDDQVRELGDEAAEALFGYMTDGQGHNSLSLFQQVGEAMQKAKISGVLAAREAALEARFYRGSPTALLESEPLDDDEIADASEPGLLESALAALRNESSEANNPYVRADVARELRSLATEAGSLAHDIRLYNTAVNSAETGFGYAAAIPLATKYGLPVAKGIGKTLAKGVSSLFGRRRRRRSGVGRTMSSIARSGLTASRFAASPRPGDPTQLLARLFAKYKSRPAEERSSFGANDLAELLAEVLG